MKLHQAYLSRANIGKERALRGSSHRVLVVAPMLPMLILAGPACNAILNNPEGYLVEDGGVASDGGGVDDAFDSTRSDGAGAGCSTDALTCTPCTAPRDATADAARTDAARTDASRADAARADATGVDVRIEAMSSGGDGAPAGTGNATTPGSDCVPAPCACVLPNAETTCINGQCAIASCRAGFRDANGSAVDGCETGDVPSQGLVLWLMADRGVTATSNVVSRWADQSATHADAVAVQMDAQAPVTRAIGPSGLPMIQFDGVGYLQLPAGFQSFTGASYFAVVNAADQAGCAGILHFSNGPDIDDIEFGRHESSLYFEVLGTFLYGQRGAFEPAKTLLVSIVQASSGNVELRINGLLNGASPCMLSNNTLTACQVPGAIVRRQNFVGKDAYTGMCTPFKGQVGEILLYARGVTELERAQVETYIQAKWNVGGF
jgi:hypothetical protein